MKTLNELLLCPRPRRVRASASTCPADAPIRELRDAAQPDQGYRLRLAGDGITLAARDDAGRYYGRQTLAQIRRLAGAKLPCGEVEDHPDFAHRGVMLDISRNRVPTMERLFALVDQLAALKINHLELYTEHTFAYANHREVWEKASPMTAEEIRALDTYCQARFIELAPNQNSFGHLRPWLERERYRDLAECPDGHEAWGEWRPYPFSLNPLDPRSLALLEELYAELLPNYTSRRFNVGCDETVDLGQGRSKEACAQRGKGRVYLDFLQQVHKRVKQHDRTMLFWGDIILHHPELIPELPRDAVALVWGYEANHPFERECAAFAAAGREFWVCPGTSSWNSLAGRTANMRENLLSAAEQGVKQRARGFLITDWGDNGHWQPAAASWPAFALGAALSWCLTTNRGLPLGPTLDAHIFQDKAGGLGAALLDLGDVYRLAGDTLNNASLLFRALHMENPRSLSEKTDRLRLAAAEEAIARALAAVGRARPADASISTSLELAAEMLRCGISRARWLVLDEEQEKTALHARLAGVISEFSRQWLDGSRPGGLDASLSVLKKRFLESD